MPTKNIDILYICIILLGNADNNNYILVNILTSYFVQLSEFFYSLHSATADHVNHHRPTTKRHKCDVLRRRPLAGPKTF